MALHFALICVLYIFVAYMADGMTFNLGEFISTESIVGDLYKFCNMEGLHLGVIVNPFNEVHETNEDDNTRAIPVTINDCGGRFYLLI